MPAYRSQETIAAAIESVLAQDYPNLVLGIGVPARDSTTLAVVRRYTGDPRIVVVEQSGRGISDGRNLVIARLPADYYMFLDADDQMMSGVVSAFVKHREEIGEAGLRYGHYVRKLQGEQSPEQLRRAPFLGRVPSAFLRLCLLNYVGGSGNVMIDREVFERVGVYDVRLPHGEDWHLFLRIAREFPVFGLDRITHMYSYGKLSGKHIYNRSFFDHSIAVVNELCPSAVIRMGSIMCIHAMWCLYYLRTFRMRRTWTQYLDIRLQDVLSVPPGAAIQLLRRWKIV
jgi:glycosyltransferase involved in cell wall biosynthesis